LKARKAGRRWVVVRVKTGSGCLQTRRGWRCAGKELVEKTARRAAGTLELRALRALGGLGGV